MAWLIVEFDPFGAVLILCPGMQNSSAPANHQSSTHLAQDGKADLGVNMREAAVSHGHLIFRNLHMLDLSCTLQVVSMPAWWASLLHQHLQAMLSTQSPLQIQS